MKVYMIRDIRTGKFLGKGRYSGFQNKGGGMWDSFKRCVNRFEQICKHGDGKFYEIVPMELIQDDAPISRDDLFDIEEQESGNGYKRLVAVKNDKYKATLKKFGSRA